MSFLDVEAGNVSKNSSNLIDTFTQQLKLVENSLRNLQKHRLANTKEIQGQLENELFPSCKSIRDKIISTSTSHHGSKLHNDFQLLSDRLNSLEHDYADIKTDIMTYEHLQETRDKHANSKGVNSELLGHDLVNVDEGTPLLQHQQQQQQQQVTESTNALQEEVDFQTMIEQERSEHISNIHTAVGEVNAIFKQLGSLVKDQGQQIDTIDDNINQFSENIQRANGQLKKADEHQRKKNRCGLVALIIGVVFTLIFILAIVN